MFEIAPLGLILGSIGLLYMMTFGNRLLPDRGHSADLTDEFRMDDYLTELDIPEGSPLIRHALFETPLFTDREVDVLAVIRDGQPMTLPHADIILERGDILRVRCDLDEVKILGGDPSVRLRPRRHWEDEELETGEAVLIEAVVAPNSRLVGHTLREVDFRNRYGATVLAIRHHDHLVHSHLPDTELSAGDALLVEVPAEHRGLLRTHRDFVVVSDVPVEAEKPRKVIPALAVVAGVVALAALGVAPIEITAVIGAVGMVVVGALNMDQAYRAVEWRVIFLLGGLLGLGTALETTGVAEMMSEMLIQGTGVWGPIAVVSGVYLLTSLLTSVMSNNATAALIMPVALSAAATMGMNPRALVIAVAFGASASFMTPVGYQTNLLVYGPGSYRFSDYLRVGGPLNLVFWVLATFLIPVFWPL
jgi:di/tricarboxylate transporter